MLFRRAGRSLESTSRAIDFTLDLDQDVALRSMCSEQAKVVQAWKSRWLETVFPDMVARPKWRSTQRNLRAGDVGHVKYQKAVGQDDWRLAMVETAEPQTRHRQGLCLQNLKQDEDRHPEVRGAHDEGGDVDTAPGGPAGPLSVRDDVKLGLGGDCASCPPSPLLHEVKLPGLVAGGFCLKSHVGWGLTRN